MATLPTYNAQPCCDPLFRSLLSRAIQRIISASQARLAIEDIAAKFDGYPFKTSWVTKIVSIQRIVDKNDVEGLRLLDFLRIVLHHNSGEVESMENIIKKVIRKERLFQLGSETYCYLEDAERLLHHIQSSFMLDLTPPRHSEACWYKTKHKINIPVSYHESSQMVNVTRVLNMLNTEELRSCTESILPAVQELRGSRAWEGHYIDITSMNKVLRRLGSKVSGVPGFSPVSPNALHDTDSNHFAIIATRGMIEFIFLNRDNKTVKCNGRKQTIDDAVKVCEQHGLLVAQRAIREGVRVKPEWTLHYDNEQNMNLFEGDSPTEATEHNSFTFSTSQFAFKKRKVCEDVPDLPLPRGPLVRGITGREKCASWIEASHKTRPTRFNESRIAYDHL